MTDNDRFIADWWKRDTDETRRLLEAEERDVESEYLDLAIKALRAVDDLIAEGKPDRARLVADTTLHYLEGVGATPSSKKVGA